MNFAGAANSYYVEIEARLCMALLMIENIRPGMVLADHVKDRRGRLLIPKGVVLEDGHLRSFRMWGISHVEVQGEEPADAVDQPEPWAIQAAQAELADVFRHTDLEHPFIAQLYQCATSRRASEHAKEAYLG